MKLRIRGNSIRLRLSKRDVKIFKEKMKVEDSIYFAGGTLTYSLLTADIPKLKCDFDGSNIQVWIPHELGEVWVNSQLVGMEHLDDARDGEPLRILVEKDFQCLHVRINEDESDAFPRPVQ